MKIPRFSISLALLVRDTNTDRTPPKTHIQKEESQDGIMGSLQRNPTPTTTFRPKKNSVTLQNLFEKEKPTLPTSNGVVSSPNSGNEEILSVISYCSSGLTFPDPSDSPSPQDFKRLHLSKLLAIIKSSKKPLPEKILEPLVSMISLNLFRPLPPPANPSALADFPDDEDPSSTFSHVWSHLQIVYEILQEYMDHPFLLKLFALFQSEDTRERESLKNVYRKIYSKFTCERSFMRKSMNDVLLNYVFEIERHAGIAELLDIWGTIINGFTVPQNEKHKLF